MQLGIDMTARGMAAGAASYAAQAEGFANEAETSKDAAAVSESNALTYKNAAASSAAEAQAAVGNIAVLPGFYNLKADTTSNNIVVTANYAVLRNSAGTTKTLLDINIGLDVTIGTTLLDDGTTATANDTWYKVWLIYNPTTQVKQLILSAESATAPTLPSGYTHYVFVMCIRGTSGSLYHLHKDNDKKVTYIVDGTVLATVLPVLASGTASLTSLYVRDVVPSVAAYIQLILNQRSSIGDHHLRVQPNSNWTEMYLVAFYYNRPLVEMYLESDYIYWMSGDSSNKIYCLGWIDNL
jgi:hypothetical protein